VALFRSVLSLVNCTREGWKKLEPNTEVDFPTALASGPVNSAARAASKSDVTVIPAMENSGNKKWKRFVEGKVRLTNE
jgi:hypothetical protein